MTLRKALTAATALMMLGQPAAADSLGKLTPSERDAHRAAYSSALKTEAAYSDMRTQDAKLRTGNTTYDPNKHASATYGCDIGAALAADDVVRHMRRDR